MNREEYKTLREAEHRGYVRGYADKKIEGRALFDQGLARGQENLEAQVKAAEQGGRIEGLRDLLAQVKAAWNKGYAVRKAEGPKVSEIDGFKRNPGEIEWPETTHCGQAFAFTCRSFVQQRKIEGLEREKKNLLDAVKTIYQVTKLGTNANMIAHGAFSRIETSLGDPYKCENVKIRRDNRNMLTALKLISEQYWRKDNSCAGPIDATPTEKGLFAYAGRVSEISKMAVREVESET